MLDSSSREDGKHARIILGLLDSVERDGAQSQRHLAAELGIALGLVNAYLKRCVKKGLVKASEAPARRFVYYLTPQGFAEKSRLTVEYLSSSFGFFRRAKEDSADLFEEARARGFDRVALIGRSDLAEIAAICALESGVKIVAMIDPNAAAGESYYSLPIVRRIDDLTPKPPANKVTDLLRPRESSIEAIEVLGESRVLIPRLLRVRLRVLQEVES
jgi:DNA-binding MarR family transcriptional regulator